ncbi:MAG: 2'-5' RNA ligase family protein [Flavisolibacter sp.]
MEPVNLHMPGYKMNEYLLVLNPHHELAERIADIKEEFSTRYKTQISRYTKPHISLVNFLTWEMMEEKLLQRLQAIAMGITPFKVELKDYGSFPSHSIFINVISKIPVQNLVRELKEAQRLMKLNNENKPHFIDEPYILISAKLKPWQYEQGWLEYSHRNFTSRFIADGMLLLRRTAGERSRFQIAKRFDFLNLPVTTKQGDLFI